MGASARFPTVEPGHQARPTCGVREPMVAALWGVCGQVYFVRVCIRFLSVSACVFVLCVYMSVCFACRFLGVL